MIQNWQETNICMRAEKLEAWLPRVFIRSRCRQDKTKDKCLLELFHQVVEFMSWFPPTFLTLICRLSQLRRKQARPLTLTWPYERCPSWFRKTSGPWSPRPPRWLWQSRTKTRSNMVPWFKQMLRRMSKLLILNLHISCCLLKSTKLMSSPNTSSY